MIWIFHRRVCFLKSKSNILFYKATKWIYFRIIEYKPAHMIIFLTILKGAWWWHVSLQWRHNECDGVPNHQPHDCLLNPLFRHRSKNTSELRVTGLCAGTGEFPAQMASNAENVSIWWRHHVPIKSSQHIENIEKVFIYIIRISWGSKCIHVIKFSIHFFSHLSFIQFFTNTPFHSTEYIIHMIYINASRYTYEYINDVCSRQETKLCGC